jgi:hypothetical protein
VSSSDRKKLYFLDGEEYDFSAEDALSQVEDDTPAYLPPFPGTMTQKMRLIHAVRVLCDSTALMLEYPVGPHTSKAQLRKSVELAGRIHLNSHKVVSSAFLANYAELLSHIELDFAHVPVERIRYDSHRVYVEEISESQQQTLFLVSSFLSSSAVFVRNLGSEKYPTRAHLQSTVRLILSALLDHFNDSSPQLIMELGQLLQDIEAEFPDPA